MYKGVSVCYDCVLLVGGDCKNPRMLSAYIRFLRVCMRPCDFGVCAAPRLCGVDVERLAVDGARVQVVLAVAVGVVVAAIREGENEILPPPLFVKVSLHSMISSFSLPPPRSPYLPLSRPLGWEGGACQYRGHGAGRARIRLLRARRTIETGRAGAGRGTGGAVEARLCLRRSRTRRMAVTHTHTHTNTNTHTHTNTKAQSHAASGSKYLVHTGIGRSPARRDACFGWRPRS